MLLLRCHDPKHGQESFETSRLAKGADCIERSGATALVDGDDDSGIGGLTLAETSPRARAIRTALPSGASHRLTRVGGHAHASQTKSLPRWFWPLTALLE